MTAAHYGEEIYQELMSGKERLLFASRRSESFNIPQWHKSNSGESLINKPIKELAQELDPDKFWQIHRSTIVNVSCITKVSRSLTGRHVLKLTGVEEPLTVSRTYSYLFKQM